MVVGFCVVHAGEGALPPPSAEVVAKRKEVIRHAFGLFDRENKGVVVQEEISTIMRYMVCATPGRGHERLLW